MDLATGRQNLIVSLAEAARIPYAKGDLTGAKHWFNHLLVSPDGARFTFLHRWSGEKGRRRYGTRMLTADAEGGNIHVLDPHGETSHFIWCGPRHILAWAWHPSQGRKFYLYEDRTEKVEVVAPQVMTRNGHCTYLPGNRWILNDTYPDSQRNQNVYLYGHENRKAPLVGPVPLPGGISRRVALRHPPALQPRRTQSRHRLASRWGRQAASSDRHRRDCRRLR